MESGAWLGVMGEGEGTERADQEAPHIAALQGTRRAGARVRAGARTSGCEESRGGDQQWADVGAPQGQRIQTSGTHSQTQNPGA